MAWIEVHQNLSGHRKTRKMAKLLNEKRVHVVGYLVTLWSWALDNAPNGRIDNIGSDVLADAAEYEGNPDEFLEALIDVCFVDRREDSTLWLHDWEEYTGRLIQKRAKNAERMREARAAEKEARDDNVQRTCNARAGATVPNSTVPNHTPPNPPQGDGERGKEKTKKRRQPPVEPDGYADAYENYPRHEKRAEGAALYGDYSPEERPLIDTAITNYAAYNRYYGKEQDKIMLIPTFLSWENRPWVDWTREENAKWAKLPVGARFTGKGMSEATGKLPDDLSLEA